MNPASPKFSDLSEMAHIVGESGAATIMLLPLPDISGTNQIPQSFQRQSFPVFFPGQIAPPDANHTRAPDYWPVVRDGDHLKLDGVVFGGFAPGSSLVRVGGSLARSVERGYFQMVAKPGSHESQGVEEAVYVQRLHPLLRFYRARFDDIRVPDDDRLNIIAVISDSYYERNFNLMAYSAVNNTRRRIRFWVMRPPTAGFVRGADLVALPTYFPPFVRRGREPTLVTSAAKLYGADLLLPPTVRKFLFADQSIIFNGDVERFERIRMNGAVIAAPLYTESKSIKKSSPFFERHARMRRFDRPLYSSCLIWADLERWREVGFGRVARAIQNDESRVALNYGFIDMQILSVGQLHAQFLALPADTAFSYHVSTAGVPERPFSYFCFEKECEEVHFGRNGYQRMIEEANKPYIL